MSQHVKSISPCGDRLALPSAACWKVSAMNCFLDSWRAIWSTAVVIGSFFILSGCKHIDRGSSIGPSVSAPYAQPYDGEPLLDTPTMNEPLPELSPVPPLPGAGHSVPPEPLPPPAPAEPTSAQSEPGKQPVSQIKPFWSQMTASAATGRSTPISPLPKLRQGRHAAVVLNAVSNRTMDQRLAAAPFGVSTSTPGTNSIASNIHETTVRDFHSLSNLAGENNNQRIESVSSPALRGGLSFPASRSALAEVEAKGLVIAPMQQPITTRSGVIEDWPYRLQPLTFTVDARKNVLPQQASEEQATPSNETQFGSTEQAPSAAQEEATVPSLLLPPGP